MRALPTRRRALAALGAAVACARPPAARAAYAGVPVFMYHHVNDTRPENTIALGLTLPTANFEAHLRYLADQRIATLTAGELVGALARGHRPVRVAVLTFDDGYADAASIVFPLLKRYGARATFFVNGGTIEHRGHVSWRELRAMRAAGNELGAHGEYHLDLTTLDRAGQMREAGECVARIARWTGFRPVSYAYASGAYDATTLLVMRAIGITSAWTEHYGFVHDARNPYEMPRVRITRDTGESRFAALLRG
jgi:peptidoglycan/xylan/chitin deacetylase (PgdA/CDA1 family)